MGTVKKALTVVAFSLLLSFGSGAAFAAEQGGTSEQVSSLTPGAIAVQSDDDSSYDEDDASHEDSTYDDGYEPEDESSDDESYDEDVDDAYDDDVYDDDDDEDGPEDLRYSDVYVYDTATSGASGYTYAMKSRTYTGKAISPKPVVAINEDDYYDPSPKELSQLKRGVDYKLSYKNNVKVGTAKVYVTGIGDYTGTISRSFKICASISKAKVAKVAAKTFKGKAIKPAPKVTYKGKALKKGTDYTLSYKSNAKAGTAVIQVKGKGNYIGTKTAKFKINKCPLKSVKIAKVANQTYTGKALKPNPKVSIGSTVLKKGVDYTVSYAKNKARGTAKMTIKGKGSYTGQRTATFKIVAAKKKASTKKSASAKSGTVYITNTGAKFHRGTCRWLYKSKIPISRSEAIAEGYDACKVCKP